METILDSSGSVLAFVLRASAARPGYGIDFHTRPTGSLQLGTMRRPAGYVVPRHRHVPAKREIEDTREVLFIRSGRVAVTLWEGVGDVCVADVFLEGGDVILLRKGWHGLEMLEDTEIVEVKQGPYRGADEDKTHDPS